ncbi:MAG: PIG-L family deacetylase [Acidimicrobiales bacterium]|nr:PIG-L family deacetylase [Actinomycetota bacterium]
MGTIVSFHAHPDDESIATGGLLARAADAGHRVVLVFGTRGELGEPVAGVLGEGEQLTLRRTAEVFASAEVLGVQRVEFLGWTDSGMIGLPTNDVPWCFWQADVDHAAARLALILQEEQADVITTYDHHGGYGHPDHIQVHRVGARAAELAGVAVVAQSTMNRDHMQRAFARAAEMGVELPVGEDGEETRAAEPDFGTPEAELTHCVDAGPVIDRKRASMLSHASQIGADHFMVSMPPEAFDFVFGTEWFVVDPQPGPDAPAVFHELFAPMP